MTGHLVYTTSHTNSVPETLRRLVSAFPAEGRDGRLADLLEALQTIVTQRLVRTTDGRRAAVHEYLRFTPELKDALLAQPPAQVIAATRRWVRECGRPLTADLDALRAAGRIDEREYRLFRGLGTQTVSISSRSSGMPDVAESGDDGGP
jgi:defect-in-organelle-trafficking protein DotB